MRSRGRTLRRILDEERGQAFVEFVVALPLLVIVLFALAEFGIAFNHYLQVTDAARVGARTAAVSRLTGGCVPAIAAANQSLGSLVSKGAQVICDIAPTTPGDPTKIRVIFQQTFNVPLVPLPTVTLTSTATERTE